MIVVRCEKCKQQLQITYKHTEFVVVRGCCDAKKAKSSDSSKKVD